MSRKSTKIECVCEVCQTTFHIYPSEIKPGVNRGRFCSWTCFRSTEVSLKTHFLRHVGPPNENGCVLWTGTARPSGYGYITLGSRMGNQKIAAHRASWELHNGPIPDSLCVLHRCDVRLCVAPEHLFLGTNADNTADMIAKGRQAIGEKSGLAKLTQEQVRQIRDRYAAGGISQRTLAREYRVRDITVSAVIRRRNWKHI